MHPGSSAHGNGRRALRRMLVIVGTTAIASAAATDLCAQAMRRLSAGVSATSYVFDGDYWGADTGFGADLVIRCEIANNLFFENRLGGYSASGEGSSLKGFSGRIGLVHFLPFLIPYRPSVNAGLAVITADPAVSEPVETFHPSQTILYFVTGGGISWSLKEYLQLELDVDLFVTPYRYRVYHFYRQYVETDEERFFHASFTLGACYIF